MNMQSLKLKTSFGPALIRSHAGKQRRLPAEWELNVPLSFNEQGEQGKLGSDVIWPAGDHSGCTRQIAGLKPAINWID